MITSRKSACTLLAAFLLVISKPSPGLENPARCYPFPVAEMEEAASKWLQSKGFEVTRLSPEGSRVQLTGVNGKECWVIHLEPHSPLASRVSADYRYDSRSDSTKKGELLEFLALYPDGPFPGKAAAPQTIPVSILSQNEFVVCIKAEREERTFQFSGFIIGSKGLILATAHDLKNIHEATVTLYDGREYKGRLVKIDFDRDLALIDIGIPCDSFISLGKSRNLLGLGERVYSVGCPMNLKGTINSGLINGPPRRVGHLTLWQATMEVLPGGSGSPVFDVQGNLAAVVKGRFRGTDSVGFLIPVGTVMEFLMEKDSL
ncbi:MAG: S1 family peptidase [bacterium]